MNLIDATFERLKLQGKKAFIPFLTAGDPSLAASSGLLDEVIRKGADLVEIGFPYSDPIADGAIIQASYTRALKHGIKIGQIFDMVANWRKANPQNSTPLVAMVSYSLVHRQGVAEFLDQARQAGFSGAIVPDLPVEEADALVTAAQSRDFKLIQLVTPTTPRDRALQIVQQSSGFLYCVSVTGITGTRDDLPAELQTQLKWLREQTPLPLCVGFGVSKPEHARMLRGFADGIIVGSALVRLLESENPLEHVGQKVRELRAALDSVS
jgi:tryptophan synthase alpha chain